MASLVTVNFHASQFPERVRLDLRESLRTRRVQHKFHYDSVKQTAQWLALHQAYSPSRTDPDCARTYDLSFKEAMARITAPDVQVIGLGCGGGQKDTRLLKLLLSSGKQVCYVPCDVSAAMVLEAREQALAGIPDLACFPLVCDLGQTDNLRGVIDEQSQALRRIRTSTLEEDRCSPVRLYTFFGMIPNFEPTSILPRLAGLVSDADLLLFSANLAPGMDYEAGIRQILPLYDNALTREWLLTFLLDLGVEREDGESNFRLEEDPKVPGLKRIAAYFRFGRPREVTVEGERFEFKPGEEVRLFFSYRYTPALLESVIAPYGFRARERWVTRSGEEGVFLVTKAI